MAEYHDVAQEPLLSSSSLDCDDASDSTVVAEKTTVVDTQRSASRANRLRNGLLLGSLIVNVVLFISLGALFARYTKRVEWGGVPQTWTPANHINDHVYVRFPDVHDITPYAGYPTPEIDEAWQDLYKWGISAIPKSEAAKLDGPTVPFSDNPDLYIVQMDVFHQLHCLNSLRKSLYPEYYSGINATRFKGILPREHLEHCVNNIRESLMCSADTTPNRWEWDPSINASDPRFHFVHTCRNFDAIRQYAIENTAKTHFDIWTYAGDDLKYPDDPYKDYEVIQRFTPVDLHEFHHNNYTYLEKLRPHPDEHPQLG